MRKMDVFHALFIQYNTIAYFIKSLKMLIRVFLKGKEESGCLYSRMLQCQLGKLLTSELINQSFNIFV